jgi:hypothetical protein
MRSRGVVVAGVGLSLVFAYLSVRGLDLADVRAALARQRYVFLLPAGAALAAAVALRVWRWQLLFGKAGRPRYTHVASALLVGYLFNTILPARAGEVARVQVLGRRAGISRAQVLTTVVLERAYDLVVLVVLLALALPFVPAVGWLGPALAVGAAAAAVLALAAVVARRPESVGGTRALALLSRVPGLRSPWARKAVLGATAGLGAVRSVQAAAAAAAVTAASWLALAASTWLLLLGTELRLDAGAALLVVVATNLVLVMPSAPAALGAFEAATIAALAAYDVGRAEALSFALVLHALNALPYLPLGYGAWALHVRARGGTADLQPPSNPDAGAEKET